MASCQTSRWVSTAPYVKLTVTETNNTNSAVTYSWTLDYISDTAANTNGVGRAYTVTFAGSTVKSGTYNINGKKGTNRIASGTKTINKTTAAQTISFGVTFSFKITWSGSYKDSLSASGTVSVAAKPKYTVSYNANGGSGAPSSQTKWYGTTLTLSSTKPTRTGYTFQGWATSASGSVAYAAGASYTANAAVTLYAVWKVITYTVTYNANGGTNAPSKQTKTYGVTLKLSTTKPTRTDYNFKGWATSASGSVAYAAGGNYTSNAAVTLYAVWEVAYVEPRITNFSVSRCDANKNITDDGTYALIEFDWECDKTITGINISWTSVSSGAGSKNLDITDNTSDTSGRVSSFESGFNTESSYTITVIVTDSGGSSPMSLTLPGLKFGFDACVDPETGDVGASIGKPAEQVGLFDIAIQTRHAGGLLPVMLEPGTDFNDVMLPNTYAGENASSNPYVNSPVSSGTFTLLVESCGDDGQVKQTYTSCSKYKPEVYARFYYQGAWGDWFWASTDEVLLYENASGSNAAITLKLNGTGSATSASHYRYLEIYYTDNNGKSGGYTKVWNPNGKTVCLHIVESYTNLYFRQTLWTISSTTITPDVENSGTFRVNDNSTVTVTSRGTNNIKIVRVVGRA